MTSDVILDALWDGRREDTPVLRLYGELDAFSGTHILEAIPLPLVPSELVVDLTGVTFIDGGGLSLLLQLKRRWQDAGGSVAVRGARERVRRLLHTTDLQVLPES